MKRVVVTGMAGVTALGTSDRDGLVVGEGSGVITSLVISSWNRSGT